MSDYNINVIISGPNNEHTATYKTFILRDNTSFADQVTEPNTKYVVKWDFNLNGETVTVPENCIIEFDGGTLKNGTIIGQDTVINDVGGLGDSIIFGEGITKQGTWKQNGGSVEQIQSDWNQTDTSKKDFIKNKPTIPVVPTKVSSFENDANYVNISQLGAKQDRLISGNNIKTINNQSVLGNGNIQIEGGSTIDVDAALSKTSTNPVQNKVIAEALENASSATDKEYDPTAHSGLGVKYLKLVGGSNILRQSDFDKSNTIYVIANDFDLDGASITIPENCILDFDGGSISNGTLIGTDTQIRADNKAIFTGINISGTWNVPYITTAWFSDAEDVSDVEENKNKLAQVFNLCSENIQNYVQIEDGTFYVSVSANYGSAILLTSNTIVNIKGTVQLLGNGFPRYRIFNAVGKNNITIEGSGSIIGDELNHDYATTANALGTKVVSTNAANTPNIASLYTGSGYIKGTLEPSASIAGNCYWVRRPSFGTATRYTYYIVTEASGVYEFKRTNSHEWGMGINCINGAEDINIKNISISLCTGDGIYIGSASDADVAPNSHINVSDVYIEKCRRQGVSITHGNYCNVKNCFIADIDGTPPMAGIDVEPNNNHSCENIFIEGNTIQNCHHGVIMPSSAKNNEYIKNAVVRNNIISCDNEGVRSRYIDGTFVIEGNEIYCKQKCIVIGGDSQSTQVVIQNNIIKSTITSTDTEYDINNPTIFLWGVYNALVACNTIETDGESVFYSRNNCTYIGNKIVSNYAIFNTHYKGAYRNVRFANNDITVAKWTSKNDQDGRDNWCFDNNVIHLKNSLNIYLFGVNTFCNNRILKDSDTQVGINFNDKSGYIRCVFNSNYVENAFIAFHTPSSTVISDNLFVFDANYIIVDNTTLLRPNGMFRGNTLSLDAGIDLSNLSYIIYTGSNGDCEIDGNVFNLNHVATNKFLVASNSNTRVTNNVIRDAENITSLIGNNVISYFVDGTYQKRGTTTNRPTLPSADCYKGFNYYDTTLGKPIYWNGTGWVDANGATV